MTRTPSCFTLENFELQCGAVLPKAQLVYQTYGELKGDSSNVILYPTSYGAQHTDIDWLIRPDGILDPTRWFIIIPSMFGNGLSSSPSNCRGCGLAEQGFWFSHLDKDYPRALKSIQAQTLVMPSNTDLYFTTEDCAAEAALIPKAEFLPIPSIWEHRAGNPYQNAEDETFIQRAVWALLENKS